MYLKIKNDFNNFSLVEKNGYVDEDLNLFFVYFWFVYIKDVF